jgi:hypothetical protein
LIAHRIQRFRLHPQENPNISRGVGIEAVNAHTAF